MAKLGRVNEELEKVSSEGIMKPVTQPTDWLSNILVKKSQMGNFEYALIQAKPSLGLFEDPSAQYPRLKKLPLLTNAKVFTIVEVSEAFYTIKLDEESSLLTTFQGPSSRYCYTRMPFGIASGPEEYQ